jgi:hypothetical protein
MFQPKVGIVPDIKAKAHIRFIDCIRDFKEITSTINYECDFIDGACRQSRGEKWSDKKNAERCCCIGCAYANGYHYFMLESDYNEAKAYWDDETGFWRKGKGCILPRGLRSETCLGYHCNVLNPRDQELHNLVRKQTYRVQHLLRELGGFSA